MGYTDTGTLYAQAGVDINRIEDAISTIAREFGRIADEPVDADELQKAKNFAKGRLVLSLEDPKGMILFGLRGEVLEGRVREVDEVLAGFDAVTADDIQRVAREIIRDDRLNLALIGPFDGPERFEPLLALSG
jgi:predicted Zn-dependent peptidase